MPGLVDVRGYTCAEVQKLTLEHAGMVKQKIADLTRLEATLRSIASRCTGEEVPACPMIDALLDPEDRLGLQG